MKPAHLLVPCLLLASAARAQFRTKYELPLIKAQPLVVLLEEEDPKKLKKLADKPDDLAQYKAYVAYYNTQLRELAPKQWHSSPSVEFKPASELAALRKLKKTYTVVLEHEENRVASSDNGRVLDRFNTTLSAVATVASMRLNIVGDGDINYQFACALTPGALFPSDIIFAFRTIQRRIEDEAAGRGQTTETKKEREARWTSQGQELRAKTLLLDQGEIDAKLTDADIQQLYPYPYQLVPRETIEAAVLNADARYVYVRWLTYSASDMGHVLINAADCRTLGQSVGKGGPGRNPAAAYPIGKSNLKQFAGSASYGMPSTK